MAENLHSDVTETAKNDLVIAHYAYGTNCWSSTNADTTTFTKNTADDGGLGTLGYVETDFYVSDFSPFAFSGRFGTTLLPVELLSFDATFDENQEEVLLDWVTASEKDNDYFDVQRKKDGGKWSTIDRVYGAGTSKMNLYYSTVDANPYGGQSHYRLKQVDFDGNTNYLDVKSITSGFMSSVVDYSVNYEGGFIYVNLEDNKRSYYKMEIINIAGQVVYRNMEYSNEGLNAYQIEKLLEKGMYYVIMSNDSEIYSTNIVVK